MRADTIAFAAANKAPDKSPRFVLPIIFDTASLHPTSHSDIPNVPGVPIQAVIEEPSAISMKIVPDEGRSEIGSFSFTLIDRDSSFTNEVRTKLQAGKGLRGKKVELRHGFAGFDYTAFQLFQTQIITGVEYEEGRYRIECADITRELRKQIFEPVSTTLQASVSATDAIITVADTTKFFRVVHGTGWSDAPSATVGYLQLENEWIRYTGTTPTTFTGCTRGVFNTLAVPHAVDPATPAERRPKVTEVIYLEMPAPMLAYAVMTGVIHGTADVLPAHWHLGIPTSFVRLSDFTGIGKDLWDTADPNAGVVLRFEGLTKTDGKRFLEREVYLPLGCFSPIYSDGTLGLKRMAALISDAAPVATLTEREIVRLGALEHDYSSLHNRFKINWGYDLTQKIYTRAVLFDDATSRAIHSDSPLYEVSFRGLHSSRNTDATVRKRLDAVRDRYSSPPQRLTLTVLGSLNELEVGDVVRVKVANMRDFAGAAQTIDRAFEIQQRSLDLVSGDVLLELFASTARPDSVAFGTGTPLPDAFYSSQGVALSTVIGITGNTVNAGTHAIAGGTDMTAAPSIFYHLSDLELPNGATLNLTGNVQLRIRGHFTVNGVIVGTGGGKSGVADGGGAITNPILGTPGYVGNSRGADGVDVKQLSIARAVFARVETIAAGLTLGANATFPFLDMKVSGNALIGLPTDLRGTSGAPGGRILRTYNAGALTAGGPGAASGAGLAIISRGGSFGASGSITLSGNSSAATTLQTDVPLYDFYPGAGAAGGPGALFWGLDGDATMSKPNIGGRFFALCGNVPGQGVALTARAQILDGGDPFPLGTDVSGYPDPAAISGADLSNAALQIQYIPQTLTPADDALSTPPAITGLTATGGPASIVLKATLPALEANDVVEFYASIDNNRTNSVLVGEGRQSLLVYDVPALATRWNWARIRRNRTGGLLPKTSEWFPVSATDGRSATALDTQGATGPAGADGLSVAELAIYRRSATAPATPTGGSYNFGTQALTPPTDWSSAVPAGNDPVYTSRGVAAVVGQTGIDSSITWSSPVLVLAEGLSVDIIFKRSTLQPATPAPSAGVPATWFSDVNSVPAGGDPIWASVGERANAGQNWTWQTPARITGLDSTGNLLRVETWTRSVDLSVAVGNFTLNQSMTGENDILVAGESGEPLGPHDHGGLLWRCQCLDPLNGTGGEQNGGWENTGDLQGLDAKKSYRAIVWLRWTGTAGANQFYLGCDVSNTNNVSGGGANSNPYFLGGIVLNTLPKDRWLLAVGMIHGENYVGGHSGVSGIYDPTSGRRIVAGNDFRMKAAATQQNHRAYMYYGGDTGQFLYFAEPRFEPINGNEPSMLAVLGITNLEEGVGNLPDNIGTHEGSNIRIITHGLAVGSAADGDSVTFSPAWTNVPEVRFTVGGLTFNASLSGDQIAEYAALNLSGSGFTARLKTKELSGAQTGRTDSTVSTPSSPTGLDTSINKGQTDEAYDDRYTYNFNVTLHASEPTTVDLYSNDGSGWVLRLTKTYPQGSGSQSKSETIVVDGLGLNDDFGLDGDVSSPTFTSVTYVTAAAPVTESATPTGAGKVDFFVLGG